MTTPREAVEDAILRANPDVAGTMDLALAAIEALRERKQAQPLDPDHSPPASSPDEWEAFANGYNKAISDILGSPESTESAAES